MTAFQFLFLSVDLYFHFYSSAQAQLFLLQCLVVKEEKKIQNVVTRYFLLVGRERTGVCMQTCR